MSDAAARREARRRRILENSESRMQKIFGTGKDEPNEEKAQSVRPLLKIPVDNGVASENQNSKNDNNRMQTEKSKDVLERDSTSKKREVPLLETMYSELDNHFALNQMDQQYSLKDNKKTCDNLNFNSTTLAFEQQATCQQKQPSLFTLFFTPLSSVLLALFINILLLANVDFSSYKGIVLPYFVLSITRLCFENKSEEFQGSNMLVAALILCNIKPGMVYNLKKVLSICDTLSRDLSLYLTSFVLFNWILSMLWTGSNFLQLY